VGQDNEAIPLRATPELCGPFDYQIPFEQRKNGENLSAADLLLPDPGRVIRDGLPARPAKPFWIACREARQEAQDQCGRMANVTAPCAGKIRPGYCAEQ